VVLIIYVAVNIDDGNTHVRKAVHTPKPTPLRVGDADRPKTLQGDDALLLFWHILQVKDFLVKPVNPNNFILYSVLHDTHVFEKSAVQLSVVSYDIL